MWNLFQESWTVVIYVYWMVEAAGGFTTSSVTSPAARQPSLPSEAGGREM